MRWQRGTSELPPHCLGHLGYAVVPCKQGLGCAKAALKRLCVDARAEGLAVIQVTTDPGNIASQRMIEANSGELTERFVKPAQFGDGAGLRYRIAIA
ncbi:MAG: GNAT family N-acetyltransferase [Casimicrobiaceae bacterium]